MFPGLITVFHLVFCEQTKPNIQVSIKFADGQMVQKAELRVNAKVKAYTQQVHCILTLLPQKREECVICAQKLTWENSISSMLDRLVIY